MAGVDLYITLPEGFYLLALLNGRFRQTSIPFGVQCMGQHGAAL